jgi:hypothetical protein
MSKTQINYDAEVPFEAGAPFRINVSSENPPGDYKYKDFIPKEKPVPVTANTQNAAKEYKRSPQRLYEEDYIPPNAAQVVRKSEKDRIREIARELYEGEAELRKEQALAKKLLDSTQQALGGMPENPTKEVRRAIRVLERTALTKTTALETAAKQFYGLS